MPQYMEKRVFCQLNGNRKVIGVLRGYDVRPVPFALPGTCVAAAVYMTRAVKYGSCCSANELARRRADSRQY